MNWPALLLGVVLFVSAGILQLFVEEPPKRWFYILEVSLAGLGGYAIAVGVIDDWGYAVGFALLWTLLVIAALVALSRITLGRPKR